MGSSVSLLWADIEGTVDFIASEAINRGTCKFQWFLTLPVETGREGGESPTNASKRLLRAVRSNLSNLEYISKFVAKPGHFVFIYVFISFVSLLKCSPLFYVFLFPSLASWILNLSLLWFHQTNTEPQDSENREETWGYGRARAEDEQTERCQSSYQSLSSFAVPPLPHPWLCCSYVFGCTCQTHSYTPLKKERTSIASSMHPHDTNFAASDVDLQLVQNLAVNWQALTDLYRGTSVSTRYTLICKYSLILSAPVWP